LLQQGDQIVIFTSERGTRPPFLVSDKLYFLVPSSSDQ
jgi:hypothetical protein